MGGSHRRLHSWVQESFPVPTEPFAPRQLVWRPRARSATPPEPSRQQNPSVTSRRENSDVSGVLLFTRTLIKYQETLVFCSVLTKPTLSHQSLWSQLEISSPIAGSDHV